MTAGLRSGGQGVERRRKTSIDDIARHAGVSRATVSRVLNRAGYISDDKRDRVLAAISTLDYVPNENARNLRLPRTARSLMIVAYLSSPVIEQIFRGAEAVAAGEGHQLFIASSNKDPATERQLFDSVRQSTFDGVVVVGTSLTRPELEAVSASLPVVQCSEWIEADVPAVSVDDTQAACDATCLLLARGHTAVGLLRDPNTGSGRAREAGYAKAFATRGLAIPGHLVEDSRYDFEAGMAATFRLMSRRQRPTAIFCTNDVMAVGCVAALRSAGHHVPGEVAVMGFDDTVEARMCVPPLTTVSQPHRELGARAMAMLLQRIAGTAPSPRHEFLPHAMVERGST